MLLSEKMLQEPDRRVCQYVTDRQATQMRDLCSALMLLRLPEKSMKPPSFGLIASRGNFPNRTVLKVVASNSLLQKKTASGKGLLEHYWVILTFR